MSPGLTCDLRRSAPRGFPITPALPLIIEEETKAVTLVFSGVAVCDAARQWCDQIPTPTENQLYPYSEHSCAHRHSHDFGKLSGD